MMTVCHAYRVCRAQARMAQVAAVRQPDFAVAEKKEVKGGNCLEACLGNMPAPKPTAVKSPEGVIEQHAQSVVEQAVSGAITSAQPELDARGVSSTL